MYNASYRTAYGYNSYKSSAVTLKSNASNDRPPQDWVWKLCEDVTEKMVEILRYTCCFPLRKDRRAKKKKRISFNLKAISSNPSTTVMEEEIPSPIAFDSLEEPELPIINPDLMNRMKKYQYNKNKIINIFYKKKKRQLDKYHSRYRNKCSGQCIPLTKMTLSEYTLSSSCSEDDLACFHVSGDGPQNRGSRNRIINFFNEIYTAPNDYELPSINNFRVVK